MHASLSSAIAACLGATNDWRGIDGQLIERVLAKPEEQNSFPDNPAAEELQQFADEHPDLLLQLDLVYAGATRVKEFVFEAPRLPEIRGASTLLDYVTDKRLPLLWRHTLGPIFEASGNYDQQTSAALAVACVIYTGGGNMLAIAPKGYGQMLATLVEQCYADWTLTASSVAVWSRATLLELRYGRLRSRAPDDPRWYWWEAALRDWEQPELAELLELYYYSGDNAAGDRKSRFLQRKGFGELVAELATLFYRRREEQGFCGPTRYPVFYPLLPHDTRCESSDNRPAVAASPSDDATLNLSTASARKRFFGQATKRVADLTGPTSPVAWFLEEFDAAWNYPAGISSWRAWLEASGLAPGSPQRTLDDAERLASWQGLWEQELKLYPDSRYAREAQGRELRAALDMSDIGAASKRYVGMIYADGNNVAQYMAVCRTPQAYKERAHKLAAAARNAVFKALAYHLEPARANDGCWVHPFEILSIGGDDLLLLVPGDRALSIALRIGVEFERAMGETLPRTLADRFFHPRVAGMDFSDYTPVVGLSAGVLIGQENTPIFFMRNLVDELLKSAKDLARHQRLRGDMGGAVDFMVLRSVTMVSDRLKSFRAAALGDDTTPDAQTIRLTGRPFSWHELAALLAATRKLRAAGMPRSQLYRLRAALERARSEGGIIASTIEYLTTQTRLRREPRDALKHHVDLPWRGGSAEDRASRLPSTPPWIRMAEGGSETLWPDIAEIFDLLAEEPTHA